jgi:hypothetical protein
MEACKELKLTTEIPEIRKDVQITNTRWENLNDELKEKSKKLSSYKQGILLFCMNVVLVGFDLQQTCSNAVPTTCQQDVFALLVPSLLTSCQWLVDNLLTRLLSSTDLLQVVPTTCYRPVIQQFVNKL